MHNIYESNNTNLDSSFLSIMALSRMLHRGTSKRLKPEIKKQLAEEYKAGLRFKLSDNSEVEVVMSADESDVYFSEKENKIFIFLAIRRDGKDYQNVNMHLLSRGTCARDKYNKFPGMQHYSRDEWRTLSKIPSVAECAYDGIMLTLIDFNKEN